METILYEKRGPIAIITLNRPDVLNAINATMRAELGRCWEDIAADDSIRTAILTGSGRAFCAGADTKDRPEPLGPNNMPAEGESWTPRNRAWPSGFGVRKPIIAAVNGVCVGGAHSILLECDIRIASTEARIGDLLNRHGLLAPVDKMVASYPMAVAMYLGLSSKLITAQQAMQWGFFSHVVEPDQLMRTALEIAEDVAARPTDVAQAFKSLAREVAVMSPDEAFRVVTESADRLRASSARRKKASS